MYSASSTQEITCTTKSYCSDVSIHRLSVTAKVHALLYCKANRIGQV